MGSFVMLTSGGRAANMGTASQCSWNASSGFLLVPRTSEGTAKPFTPVETTGGTIAFSVSSNEENGATVKATKARKKKPAAQ